MRDVPTATPLAKGVVRAAGQKAGGGQGMVQSVPELRGHGGGERVGVWDGGDEVVGEWEMGW